MKLSLMLNLNLQKAKDLIIQVYKLCILVYLQFILNHVNWVINPKSRSSIKQHSIIKCGQKIMYTFAIWPTKVQVYIIFWTHFIRDPCSDQQVTVFHQIACTKTSTFLHQILLRFHTEFTMFSHQIYYIFAPILLHFGIRND